MSRDRLDPLCRCPDRVSMAGVVTYCPACRDRRVGRIVKLTVAALAVAALLAFPCLLGCASNGFFRGPTPQSGSWWDNLTGGCDDGSGALWWIGFAGGISLLAGVYNVWRGRPGFTSIIVGGGLCVANFVIWQHATALFLPVVLATGIGSAWLAWRTLRNTDGSSFVRRFWGRARGGVREPVEPTAGPVVVDRSVDLDPDDARAAEAGGEVTG